ncbi:MAG: AmmeMemoRadiSam system radical SAM enzyme [Candidatus Aenigmarchaeota archaeon]|nr:AmmeMemoRadiSam system radical SAM enzyme [Candidatus Aenigmarchaeota archaeon]
MKRALFRKKVKGRIHCTLCPRNCFVPEGKVGYCGVRKTIKGVLYSLVYGRPASVAIDPVEKKPFFHFAPASRALSIATVGCNFSCKYCQNWDISQFHKFNELNEETVKQFNEVHPKSLIELAKERNIEGMAWTYTEPTVFFEYFYDTARLDKKHKFYQVWVSNGYTNVDAIKKAAKYLDAVNIDYKGDEEFYRKVVGGAKLEYVHEALATYKKLGVWIEVTNLLIPGYNDSPKVIKEMVKWIADNLGPETPLHFSAYYPAYEMSAPPTSLETLEKAIKIADEYLDYVYIGNVHHERESTYCPHCKKLLIRRVGFTVENVGLERKKNKFYCKHCGHEIPIKGEKWAKI